MPKLLAEFLKEKQEPFTLDQYLLDRGFLRGFTSAGKNSAKLSKRSMIRSTDKRPKSVQNCAVLVKAVFGRLVLHNCYGRRKIKNSENGGQKKDSGRIEKKMDTNSLLGSRNLFCEEIDADSKMKRGSVEGCNKSVLEETEFDEGKEPPLHDTKYIHVKAKQQEDNNRRRLLKPNHPSILYRSFEELEELVGTKPYSLYVIDKRALERTKQLLVDCVREVIESHRRRDKNKHYLKQILDADELWRLVCESVWQWSQESVNTTSLVHLLHRDFLASVEEWRGDFEEKKDEILLDIGDVILDDLINEIVVG